MFVFLSLLFSSHTADAIFSSAPSDQAFNATQLHSDVLQLINAEICDVKVKYEHIFSEAQVYVDRANALMVMQSVGFWSLYVFIFSDPACCQA